MATRNNNHQFKLSDELSFNEGDENAKSPASIKDLYLDFKSTGKLSSLT